MRIQTVRITAVFPAAARMYGDCPIRIGQYKKHPDFRRKQGAEQWIQFSSKVMRKDVDPMVITSPERRRLDEKIFMPPI